MSLTPGIIIQDRYQIHHLLGQGGFGAVYKAYDLTLQINVAVKENKQTGERLIQQFEREARLLAALRHPNLPRVTNHFIIENQGQYLVMDFIEGEDLQILLDRSKATLALDQSIAWVSQVCDALIYLHNNDPPIIHRDIKPANIKITPAANAVLVDFGIAKVYDPNSSTTGLRAYSPGYAPIEQYGMGGRSDTRSDVYSIAATLYTCLTGVTPIESVLRAAGDRMATPEELNQAIPQQINQAILKGMNIYPDYRFQSIGDFKKNLTKTPFTPEVVTAETIKVIPEKPANNQEETLVESASIRLSEISIPAIPSETEHIDRNMMQKSGIWIAGFAIIFLILVMAGIGIYSWVLPKFTHQEIPTIPIEPDIQTVEPQISITLTPAYTATSSPTSPRPTSTHTSIPPTSTQEFIPLPGNGLVTVTQDDVHIYRPALNHDQSRMVAFAQIGEYYQIVEIDPVQGGITREITKDAANHYHPRFSQDGESILISANLDGNYHIYLIDFQTGAVVQQLTRGNWDDMTPYWMPDFESFIFMSNKDGDYEIYLQHIEEYNLIQLTDNEVYDGSCVVSPDGNSIAYYSYRSGNPDIFIQDISTGAVNQLTISPERDAEPCFSPDGKWIAFESRESGNYDIWAVRTNGDGLFQITDDPINEQLPVFSPDGFWLFYQANYDGTYDIFRMTW